MNPMRTAAITCCILLAVAVLAPTAFAATLPVQNSGANSGSSGGGSYTLQLENPLKTNDLGELISSIGKWLVTIAIPIAVGFIIYAGVLYVFAGAKPDNTKKAKTILTSVFIGLVVMLIGGGFISLIVSILNIGAGQ